jgi:spore germination cell wall hydrolase CwlJ-like protein
MRKSRRTGYSRRLSYVRRNILNYRYIKRNLAVVAAVAGMGVLTALVVKYGEAADHRDGLEYQMAANYDAAFMEADSIDTVMDNIHVDAAQIQDNEDVLLTEAEDEASAFDGKFIVKTTDTLNVRADASVDSSVVGKMNNGSVGEITGTDGDWTAITSGNVTGYVMTDYILTGSEAEDYAVDYEVLVGTVNGDTVRVREDASTDSDIVTLASDGAKLEVVDETEDWVQVITDDDEEGYIMADFIDVESTYEYAMTIDEYNALYNPPEEVAEETETTEATDTTEKSDSATQTDSSSGSDETKASDKSTDSQSKPDSSKNTEATDNSQSTADTTSDSSQYSDAYLLACLVSMEAGGESYEGQLAVANVVLNRVKSGKWGSSISSVIYAANQFPCATGSVMQNYLKNGPLATAQQAANDALAGNNNIGSLMSFQNVKYVNTDSLSNYQIIGNHCFY